MNGKVLVTGGAGYIGSHANFLLGEKGYDTIVLDSLVYGHREYTGDAEFILGDIGDAELLDLIFENNRIEAVMHFAAFAYVGESVQKPSRYYNNNLVRALTLLDSMQKHKVDKFIFSSTCATYGVPDKVPVTEDQQQNPINPYGRSKFMIERILEDYAQAYSLKYTILRYFNAAGADPKGRIGEWHEPETHLIPLAIKAAFDDDFSLKLLGTDYSTPDGTCIRDYVHVCDLAQAHILSLEHLLEGGESRTYNLGNGMGYSVREVIDMVTQVSGRQVKFTCEPSRIGDPPVLVGCADKIKLELGWKPEFAELRVMVETAVNFYRNHKA